MGALWASPLSRRWPSCWAARSGWACACAVPALILAAGLAAFALGFVLGYEDDTRGGGSGFETGVLIASALILVAIAAMSGFMVGAIRRR
jgi:uncharacterized membrane protein YhiD involved in acid resistance